MINEKLWQDLSKYNKEVLDNYIKDTLNSRYGVPNISKFNDHIYESIRVSMIEGICKLKEKQNEKY